MAIDKSSIICGTDVATGLEVHRIFLYFRASRDQEIIQVFYNEFLLANGVPVLPMRKNEACYIVKDLPAIAAVDAVLDEDGNVIIAAIAEVAAFPGFTGWYNHNIGGLPNGTPLGLVFVTSINTTLQEMPIDAPNGYIITHPNV